MRDQKKRAVRALKPLCQLRLLIDKINLWFSFAVRFGGEDGTNLEPVSADHLLGIMEEWSEVISSDRDLTLALRQIEKASLDHGGSPDLEGGFNADVRSEPDAEPSL